MPARFIAVALAVGAAGLSAVAQQNNCDATVTTLADTGAGSLRAALANSSAASICFQTGLSGTITLGNPLEITRAVTITGQILTTGAPAIVISGNNYTVQPMVIDAVDNSGNALTVSISGLEITEGNAKLGGGIEVGNGIVTLTQMTITGNRASAGGGVYNQASLTMTSSYVTSNNSTDGLGGGIVNLQGGSLTLQSTNVTSNNSDSSDGGGIANSGTLLIQGGAISYNNANGPEGGGGLFINGGVTTIDAGALISGNTVTAQGAGGAGLYNANATVTIATSAILSNVASGSSPQFGGGIYNSGALTISESTLAANSSTDWGGGIYNEGALTLADDTVSTNTSTSYGSGLYNNEMIPSAVLTVNNTIIAGNVSQAGSYDCTGCSTTNGEANTIGGSAGLGPLADNGGPTQTMMPLPGGGEIGTGNVYETYDAQDQRGFSRTTNGSLDRGAVQDHYSSVSFYQQPTTTQANRTITPAVEVQVVELDGSTTNYPQGVPVTMELIPAVGMQPEGALNGTTVQDPTPLGNGVTAAVFGDLSVTAAGSWNLVATTYPGAQEQVAAYNATSNQFTTTAPVTMTQTALQVSPLPLTYGTPATLTATVTETGTGALVQAGSVAFTDNSAALQTVSVTNGVATLSGVSLTVGQHVLVASYQGSSTDGASGSGGTFTVGKATPTVTLVTPPAILPGAALTAGMLHATATGVNGVVLPGTATFSPALGTVPAAGSLTVTATFTPSDSTDYSAGTGKATFTVLGPSASGTTLSVSPASAYPGTAETVTAVVAPANGVPGVVSGSVNTTGGLGTQTLALLPTAANFTSGSAVSFSVYGQMTAYSADLNGDGVTDQVLINGASSQIEVLLSDPASPGNFLAQQSLGTYGACFYVSSVAIGDVNGDGLPDLVAACQNIGDGQNDGGPIVLFLNQGNGNFAAPTAIGGQTGQTGGPIQGALVALGNFDGDSAGVLDLVSIGVNCPTGVASCFAFQHGNGDGTFAAATYTRILDGSPSDTFSNLLAVDLSGDGIPDLAFLYGHNGVTDYVDWKTNATTPVSFGLNFSGSYLQNDDLGFGENGTGPTLIALSDLNNDGYADLAVVASGGDGSGNTIFTVLNAAQSSGTSFFTGAVTEIPYPGASSLGIADFNQDGHADLAVYSDTTNLISVLIGDGTGAFGTTWEGTVGVTAPVPTEGGQLLPVFSVGDANGDGFPDVLIVEPSANGNTSAKIAVTGGHTEATYSTTAPQQTTTYTGTTTPASKYWAGSSGQATLAVNASSVTVSWTPAAFTYGIYVPASDLQASATVNGQAATGTFVYTFTSGPNSGSQISTSTIYPAGNYGVKVEFTPSGSTTSYGLGTFLTISQATPVVTVATPGTVLPGAVVSLANVHGTATGVGGALLAGTFGYSPALGTPLASGETVTVTFTPTDTTDYVSGVSAQATLQVLAQQTTTTTLTPSVNPVLPGVTVGLTASVTPAVGTAGAVPGTEAFSVTSPSTLIQSVKLALAPATANFTASAVQTYTGNPDYNTYSADFNGDGVADLLVVPSGGMPQLLLSVPGAQPSLATAISLNLGSTCNSVIGLAVGDVNGDGLPDVEAACVNSQNGATTLVVELNQGAGNFVPSSTVTTLSPGIGVAQMVLGNFIKTGAPGLVVLAECDQEGCLPTLNYLQSDGAGNFTLVNYEFINNGGLSDNFANLLVGDFNGDGYPDVAFLHYSNASPYGVVEVWTNSGGTQPTFGQVISSSGPSYAANATISAGNGSATLLSLVSADLNLDGKPDLALTTAVTDANGSDAYSSTSIALNQTTGGALAFPAATTDTQGNGAVSSIVAADFDGDGVPDIALYDSYNGTVRVLHGTVGQGGSYSFAFTEPKLLFTVNAPTGQEGGVHQHVVKRPGSRASGVRPADSEVNGVIYPVLAVGDANGDGYPDLLVGQVTTDQYYDLIYQAQQFVTSGPSVGSTNITAPNVTTEYTAATTPVPQPGYWGQSAGSTTLDITSIATQTSLTVTPSSPVYGTAVTLSSQVINTLTGLPAQGGSVTFSEDGTAFAPVAIDSNGKASLGSLLPKAGQHTFGASYSGGTDEGTSTAPSDTVTVAKFTPTISWPTPAAITTTTPLSATQLDATAIGLPGSTLALGGSYVYTPAAGATLPEGLQMLGVTFTPTDSTDYAVVSKTVQIQVNATTRTTLSVSSATGSNTYGQAFTLTAQVVNVTGNNTSPVPGGSVTFSDSNGRAVLPVVTVVNGVASVSGVVLPAGPQTINAVYTDTAGSGELTSNASQSISIAKATPALTWATPAPITTATQLGSAQLDAVIKGVTGALLSGTATYNPAAGVTLPQGLDTLSVSFVPADTADYTNASGTVQIQVNSSGTVTSLGVSAESSTYGQPLTLTAHVVNATGTVPVTAGTVTFMDGTSALQTVNVSNGLATLSGQVLGAGTQTLSATYNGTSAEPSSTGTNTVMIGKAKPTVSWPTPAAISSTTPLSAEQLDASVTGVTGALLNGTTVYTPPAGTTLTVGTHTLSVTFTPTDAVDYTTATATVQIQVVNTNTQTTFTVAPGSVTYGQTVTLSAQVVNTTGTAVVGSGSVVFASDNVTLNTVPVVNGAAVLSGVALGGGKHLLTASYTGAAGEGASAAAARTVTVAKATPVLTWATPGPIASTTPLSGTQLDATAAGINGAALPGVFTYTPASGTLTVGTHTLSVSFAPTDAVDYATGTAQVSIQVVPETITLTSISPATTQLGTTPLPVTVTGSGFPAGAVVQVNGTTLPTTAISATQLGVTVPGADLAKAGSLSFTIYDAGSQAISNALTLTVTAPMATAMVSAPTTTTSAQQPTVGLTLVNSYPVDIAGTFTLTFAPAGPDGVDDPAVQFSTGGRTLNFTIPAGTTTGPTATLQSGTVEGTISVGTQLMAGGVDVTPTDLQTPAAISVAASAPTVTGVTFTNTNGLLTVVVTGFSNTREMTEATFIFTGPGAVSLASAGVTVPATSLFGTWYTSPDSATFGSTFLYTQTFQLSDDTTNITGVAVTLTNTVGTSTSVSSQ